MYCGSSGMVQVHAGSFWQCKYRNATLIIEYLESLSFELLQARFSVFSLMGVGAFPVRFQMLGCLSSGSGHWDWDVLSCVGLLGFLCYLPFGFKSVIVFELYSHWFISHLKKLLGWNQSILLLFCCFNFRVKSGNFYVRVASESKIEIYLCPSGNRDVFQSLSSWTRDLFFSQQLLSGAWLAKQVMPCLPSKSATKALSVVLTAYFSEPEWLSKEKVFETKGNISSEKSIL